MAKETTKKAAEKSTRKPRASSTVVPEPNSFDAYTPAQVSARVEAAGIGKATASPVTTLTLSVLAGAFIAFGAMYYLVAVTGSELGMGPTRVLGGMAFSLGLILILIGGGELFTGNVLLIIGWADNKVTYQDLAKNWGVVYGGNLVGAFAIALLASWSGLNHMGADAVSATAIDIATAKTTLPFMEAFFRGILCNVLVCLAVWLCFAAHTVGSKILAIIFPISAFVALGMEHSIANMFFIPFGIMSAGDVGLAGADAAALGLSMGGFIGNLIPVTLGNIVGGGVFVALAYYLVYVRPARQSGG